MPTTSSPSETDARDRRAEQQPDDQRDRRRRTTSERRRGATRRRSAATDHAPQASARPARPARCAHPGHPSVIGQRSSGKKHAASWSCAELDGSAGRSRRRRPRGSAGSADGSGSRRRVDRVRHVALEHDRLARAAELGDRGSARRRGARRCTDASAPRRARSPGAISADLAEVHHHHAVGDVADDVEVVGDEDVGEAELALQVLEQVEDLRLHRDVERRDRLVADDQLRVDGERAGDADALALAARRTRAGSGCSAPG